MCDKELLVAYVYDDIIDMDRARFERHLRECAACRADVDGDAQRPRRPAAWDAPRADAGFRLVQDRKPSWRAWWTPAFGLAAAAVLAARRRVGDRERRGQIRRERPAVRTGWNRTAQTASARRGRRPPCSRTAPDRSASSSTRLRSPHSSHRLTALEAVGAYRRHATGVDTRRRASGRHADHAARQRPRGAERDAAAAGTGAAHRAAHSRRRRPARRRSRRASSRVRAASRR